MRVSLESAAMLILEVRYMRVKSDSYILVSLGTH